MKEKLQQINEKLEELSVKQVNLNCNSNEYLEIVKEQLELEKEKLALMKSHKEDVEKVINFKIGSMTELDVMLTKILKVVNSGMQLSSDYEDISKLLSISKFGFYYTEHLEAENKINKVKDELNKRYYEELKSNGCFSYHIKAIYNLLDNIVYEKSRY